MGPGETPKHRAEPKRYAKAIAVVALHCVIETGRVNSPALLVTLFHLPANRTPADRENPIAKRSLGLNLSISCYSVQLARQPSVRLAHETGCS